MSDYISREAAIATAISGLVRYDEGEAWIRVKEVRESLRDAPAADVAEVQHGHWETDKEGRKTCSACGAWCICMRKDGLWLDKAAYCPYCGAKMDESEEAE